MKLQRKVVIAIQWLNGKKNLELARIMQYPYSMYSTMNCPDIDCGQQAQNLCHFGDYLVIAEMGEAYSPTSKSEVKYIMEITSTRQSIVSYSACPSIS